MAFNDLYVETTPCTGVVCHEAPGRGKAVDTYDDWCRCETSMVFRAAFSDSPSRAPVASALKTSDQGKAATAQAWRQKRMWKARFIRVDYRGKFSIF